MIETYQTKEALALLEQIGWPEWEECGTRIVMCWYADGFCENIGPDDEIGPMISDLPPHVVLCLIRNRLRAHIEARHGGPVLIAHDDDEMLLAEAAAGVNDRHPAPARQGAQPRR